MFPLERMQFGNFAIKCVTYLTYTLLDLSLSLSLSLSLFLSLSLSFIL